MPAHAFYVRHANNIEFINVEARTSIDDLRPPFVLDDVDGADFTQIRCSQAPRVPFLRMTDVKALRLRMVDGLRDTHKDTVEGNL
jgi:hypothetical protein